MAGPAIPDVFEQLRRRKVALTTRKVVTDIFFRIAFDDAGAYITVVDEKGKETDASYEYYSGHTRDLLKVLDTIQERSAFRIDWERPSDRIYLADYEYLLWQLQHCDNVVNASGELLTFSESSAKVVVHIEPEDTALRSSLQLVAQGEVITNLRLLTESYVLADNRTVFRIPPVGEGFEKLHLFESLLLPTNLEKFLSLLFSNFEQIAVRYNDYGQVTGEPKQAQPTLIFEQVDADNSLYLRVSTSLPGFNADFFENYDVARIATLNPMERTIVVSDVLQEDIFSCFADIERMLRQHRRHLKAKTNYIIEGNLFIIEGDLAGEFLHKELPNLAARFTLFGADKLKAYKVKSVTPKLSLSMSHGIDFLEGDVNLEIEGELISLFDALNQFKKHSYIQLTDGTHAIVNKEYMQKLQRIFKKKKEKVRISFFDLPIVEDLIDENTAQKTFQQSREIFLGFNTLQKARVKYPKLNTTLRPYQKHGYKWLNYLHQHKLGGCLADDMGLGKTVQTIAILADVYPDQQKPSLIVMPRTLLFNWSNEIARFRPELTSYIYHGPNRSLEVAKKHHLILTTYATVRNDIEMLKDKEFYYLVLDESQNIKNSNAQTTKAALMLKSEQRLALSGTPVENNLGELYSLFRFLNPTMFGSAEDFHAQYTIPIQKDSDKEALQELQRKIYPFVLRRVKKDVLKELPEKIEQTLFVEMSTEQGRFYEQRRAFYYQTVKSQIATSGIRKSQFFILQALTELRQIASIPEAKSEDAIQSPKREVLLEQLLDVIANGHKVLVFANFLAALDSVAEDLEQQGIDYLLMTGATRDRQKLVNQFQNDDTYKVFLMTLKTGGLGLNLTAADYIFIFDPWWNKSAENQAMDRAHRIGQDKTVFSYKLITQGTIEEKILKLQELKSELFEALIVSDGASIKSLDEQDVDFILGA